MSWRGSFVESAHELLIFFFVDHCLLLVLSNFMPVPRVLRLRSSPIPRHVSIFPQKLRMHSAPRLSRDDHVIALGPRNNRCAAIGCEIPFNKYSTRIASGNAVLICL